MPEPVELTRLRQAIEQFKARAPRDLPDGVMEGVEKIEGELARTSPPEASPGMRAAQESAYGGTGAPISQAAKGPDQPSPGQKEYSPGQRAARGITEEIQTAAKRIVEEHRGRSGTTPEPQ